MPLKQNQLDQAALNFTLAARYYQNSGEIQKYMLMKSMLGSNCLVRDNVSGAITYYMEVIDLSEKVEPSRETGAVFFMGQYPYALPSNFETLTFQTFTSLTDGGLNLNSPFVYWAITMCKASIFSAGSAMNSASP